MASLSRTFYIFAVICSLMFIQTAHAFSIRKDVKSDDNPDVYLPTPKIIRRYGYPAEIHIIQSVDGYLLELHRIPHGKNTPVDKKKLPVLLHHGILSTANDWIINGPQKSLGYMLADRGHDVWLGNARGNTYSRSHVFLNPKTEAFWNFSFHESGVYDLPAMIDYILNKTNNTEIIHIGHSMGTSMFYVMCSERPEYNKKIKLHVALAPVALITHTTSIIKRIIPYSKQLQKLVDWYNGGAVLEHGILMKLATKMFCDRDILNTNLCVKYIMDTLFGTDPKEFNQTMIPVITAHIPAGTSMRTLLHYAQIYNANKFQRYDYGSSVNLRIYNRPTPPEYDLKKVTAPAVVFYGKNDILADQQDVRWLYSRLSSPMGLYEVKLDQFNHLDFIVSIDCNSLLNYPVLDIINKTQTPGFIEESVRAAIKERSPSFGHQMYNNNDNNKHHHYNNKPPAVDESVNFITDDDSRFPVSKIPAFVHQYENRKQQMAAERDSLKLQNAARTSPDHNLFVGAKDGVFRNHNYHQVPSMSNVFKSSPSNGYPTDNNNNNNWNEKFGDLFNKLEVALHRQ